MAAIARFFRQSLFSFKALFGWLDPKVYILVKVINPAFTIIFFCMLVRYVYQSNDITPYILGNAMVLCYLNAIFGIGNVLTIERFFGTLKMVIVAPMNSFAVFVGRGFFHILDGLVTIFIGLLVGALFFGLNFQGSYLLLLIIFLVSTYSVFGLGLMLASLGLKFRDMNLIMNSAAMVMLAFTGANFPVDKFPLWVQKFSNILPLTRGIIAARQTALGGGLHDVAHLLIIEAFIGTVFVLIGYGMFVWMKRLAMRDAAFDLY